MDIVTGSDTSQPTSMRDIYQHYVGKHITVFTHGTIPLGGILKAYNGYILQLTDSQGIGNTYIPCDRVIAVSGD